MNDMNIIICALALALLAVTGCGKLSHQEFDDLDTSGSDTTADTSEPDTAEPDTSEPDTAEPDTAEPDTAEPDTSEPDTVDADVPPVEPLREVVTRPLFGDMPLENRFTDPLFSLDASTWQAFALSERRWVRLRRAVFAQTPLGMPVLDLPGTPLNPVGRGILGSANMARGEHSVSIWLGRPQDASDTTLAEVQVVLIGFGAGGELATAIGPSIGSETVLDGIVWTRFEATADGYLGWAELYIEDPGGEALYLGAPVVTKREPMPGGVLPPRIAPLEVRARFTERERVAFETAVEQRRNNPPPRLRLEQLDERAERVPPAR